MTFSDKFDIQNERMLGDNIINFCLGILELQFPNINGFNFTTYVPIFENNKWKYIFRMKFQSAPCVQIHHTANCHWVTSIKIKDYEKVILLDSLQNMKEQITTSTAIQLTSLYNQSSKYIDEVIPKVQQQNNGLDCGLFAVAFATEFCFNGYKGDTVLEFDRQEMREHLYKCLVNKKLSPFPKLSLKRKSKLMRCPKIEKRLWKNCSECDFPDSVDVMLHCTKQTCQNKIHISCTDEGKWYCQSCKNIW